MEPGQTWCEFQKSFEKSFSSNSSTSGQLIATNETFGLVAIAQGSNLNLYESCSLKKELEAGVPLKVLSFEEPISHVFISKDCSQVAVVFDSLIKILTLREEDSTFRPIQLDSRLKHFEFKQGHFGILQVSGKFEVFKGKDKMMGKENVDSFTFYRQSQCFVIAETNGLISFNLTNFKELERAGGISFVAGLKEIRGNLVVFRFDELIEVLVMNQNFEVLAKVQDSTFVNQMGKKIVSVFFEYLEQRQVLFIASSVSPKVLVLFEDSGWNFLDLPQDKRLFDDFNGFKTFALVKSVNDFPVSPRVSLGIGKKPLIICQDFQGKLKIFQTIDLRSQFLTIDECEEPSKDLKLLLGLNPESSSKPLSKTEAGSFFSANLGKSELQPTEAKFQFGLNKASTEESSKPTSLLFQPKLNESQVSSSLNPSQGGNPFSMNAGPKPFGEKIEYFPFGTQKNLNDDKNKPFQTIGNPFTVGSGSNDEKPANPFTGFKFGTNSILSSNPQNTSSGPLFKFADEHKAKAVQDSVKPVLSFGNPNNQHDLKKDQNLKEPSDNKSGFQISFSNPAPSKPGETMPSSTSAALPKTTSEAERKIGSSTTGTQNLPASPFFVNKPEESAKSKPYFTGSNLFKSPEVGKPEISGQTSEKSLFFTGSMQGSLNAVKNTTEGSFNESLQKKSEAFEKVAGNPFFSASSSKPAETQPKSTLFASESSAGSSWTKPQEPQPAPKTVLFSLNPEKNNPLRPNQTTSSNENSSGVGSGANPFDLKIQGKDQPLGSASEGGSKGQNLFASPSIFSGKTEAVSPFSSKQEPSPDKPSGLFNTKTEGKPENLLSLQSGSFSQTKLQTDASFSASSSIFAKKPEDSGVFATQNPGLNIAATGLALFGKDQEKLGSDKTMKDEGKLFQSTTGFGNTGKGFIQGLADEKSSNIESSSVKSSFVPFGSQGNLLSNAFQPASLFSSSAGQNEVKKPSQPSNTSSIISSSNTSSLLQQKPFETPSNPSNIFSLSNPSQPSSLFASSQLKNDPKNSSQPLNSSNFSSLSNPSTLLSQKPGETPLNPFSLSNPSQPSSLFSSSSMKTETKITSQASNPGNFLSSSSNPSTFLSPKPGEALSNPSNLFSLSNPSQPSSLFSSSAMKTETKITSQASNPGNLLPSSNASSFGFSTQNEKPSTSGTFNSSSNTSTFLQPKPAEVQSNPGSLFSSSLKTGSNLGPSVSNNSNQGSNFLSNSRQSSSNLANPTGLFSTNPGNSSSQTLQAGLFSFPISPKIEKEMKISKDFLEPLIKTEKTIQELLKSIKFEVIKKKQQETFSKILQISQKSKHFFDGGLNCCQQSKKTWELFNRFKFEVQRNREERFNTFFLTFHENLSNKIEELQKTLTSVNSHSMFLAKIAEGLKGNEKFRKVEKIDERVEFLAQRMDELRLKMFRLNFLAKRSLPDFYPTLYQKTFEFTDPAEYKNMFSSLTQPSEVVENSRTSINTPKFQYKELRINIDFSKILKIPQPEVKKQPRENFVVNLLEKLTKISKEVESFKSESIKTGSEIKNSSENAEKLGKIQDGAKVAASQLLSSKPSTNLSSSGLTSASTVSNSNVFSSKSSVNQFNAPLSGHPFNPSSSGNPSNPSSSKNPSNPSSSDQASFASRASEGLNKVKNEGNQGFSFVSNANPGMSESSIKASSSNPEVQNKTAAENPRAQVTPPSSASQGNPFALDGKGSLATPAKTSSFFVSNPTNHSSSSGQALSLGSLSVSNTGNASSQPSGASVQIKNPFSGSASSQANPFTSVSSSFNPTQADPPKPVNNPQSSFFVGGNQSNPASTINTASFYTQTASVAPVSNPFAGSGFGQSSFVAPSLPKMDAPGQKTFGINTNPLSSFTAGQGMPGNTGNAGNSGVAGSGFGANPTAGGSFFKMRK